MKLLKKLKSVRVTTEASLKDLFIKIMPEQSIAEMEGYNQPPGLTRKESEAIFSVAEPRMTINEKFQVPMINVSPFSASMGSSAVKTAKEKIEKNLESKRKPFTSEEKKDIRRMAHVRRSLTKIAGLIEKAGQINMIDDMVSSRQQYIGEIMKGLKGTAKYNPRIKGKFSDNKEPLAILNTLKKALNIKYLNNKKHDAANLVNVIESLMSGARFITSEGQFEDFDPKRPYAYYGALFAKMNSNDNTAISVDRFMKEVVGRKNAFEFDETFDPSRLAVSLDQYMLKREISSFTGKFIGPGEKEKIRELNAKKERIAKMLKGMK